MQGGGRECLKSVCDVGGLIWSWISEAQRGDWGRWRGRSGGRVRESGHVLVGDGRESNVVYSWIGSQDAKSKSTCDGQVSGLEGRPIGRFSIAATANHAKHAEPSGTGDRLPGQP